MDWIPTGIRSKVNYFKPQNIELSLAKPSEISKEPPNLARPLYGTVDLGPRENPTRIFVIVDEHEEEFDTRNERFEVGKPFNVGGTTYEVTGLTADGGHYEIVKSTKTVDEKPVPPTLTNGSKAIPFVEKNLEGGEIRFPEGFKGKLVLLDFWATWCGPCRSELPNLIKVYNEFHPKGLEVIGISLDNQQSLPRLADFLAKNHMLWPQIADGKGWESSLAKRYGVSGIPAAWLVDGSTGLIVADSSELRGETLRRTVSKELAKLVNTPETPTKSEEPPNPSPEKPETKEKPDAQHQHDPVLPKATEMAVAGQLTGAEQFEAMLKNPRPAKIDFPAPATQPLRGREVAERARLGQVHVGMRFRCKKCEKWHVNLGGGYAIGNDLIVTAFHVLEASETMRPGEVQVFAVRGESEVIPITAVVAADKEMDALVLRVAATDLTPLAPATDVRLGDAVYCLSDPGGIRSYFSNGIVNRLYSIRPGKGNDPRFQRVNVSTDWTIGSSGSAILDDCGNVVGHVGRISSIFSEQKKDSDSEAPKPRATHINFHEAVPIKSILTLLQ